MEQEQFKLSKYNQGMPQLFRLDALWQKLNLLMPSGKLVESNWILDRVWCELIGDAEKEDEKKFAELNKKVLLQKGRFNLYNVLMEKETFLRRLQNKQGKGTAYESLEEDEIV